MDEITDVKDYDMVPRMEVQNNYCLLHSPQQLPQLLYIITRGKNIYK